MRFFRKDGTVLRINIPTHHPDYRDMMASQAGALRRHVGTLAHWQGREPVPIETADQLDRLRAYHGRNPMRSAVQTVHHGPDGITSVSRVPSGHFFIEHHDGTGMVSGGDGPHPDFDTANAEAARLSGKPAASVSETATQYARAVHTLQRGRQ